MKRLKFRTDIDTFIEKVMPEPNTGCHIWLGSSMKNGYGKSSIVIKGKIQRLAHRVSWILHKGEIPSGIFVLHKCDNRICVNPEHLFLGTAKDNTQDMLSKNRMAYGEGHGISRLTTEEVIKIRSLYSTGNYTQYQLADKYKMTQSGISAIVNFKSRRFE